MKQSEWLIAQKVQKRDSRWYLNEEIERNDRVRKKKPETEGKDLAVAMIKRLFTKQPDIYNFKFNKKYIREIHFYILAQNAFV